MLWQEQQEVIRKATAPLPPLFGLRAFPGDIFKVNYGQSFIHGDEVQIVVDVKCNERHRKSGLTGDWANMGRDTVQTVIQQHVRIAVPLSPAMVTAVAGLDREFPDWEDRIVIEELCLTSLDTCIVAQLLGDNGEGKWSKTVTMLVGEETEGDECAWGAFSDDKRYRSEWVDIIQMRRWERLHAPKCDRCGAVKPVGQSCGCFDNNCQ